MTPAEQVIVLEGEKAMLLHALDVQAEVFAKERSRSDEAYSEAMAEIERLKGSTVNQAAMQQVCREILQIMDTYHEQERSTCGVDTPGGLEHMGDVWRLLSRWECILRKAAK
jgi:hypothetical protein